MKTVNYVFLSKTLEIYLNLLNAVIMKTCHHSVHLEIYFEKMLSLLFCTILICIKTQVFPAKKSISYKKKNDPCIHDPRDEIMFCQLLNIHDYSFVQYFLRNSTGKSYLEVCYIPWIQ